jgi:hypothetical protein
MAGKTALIAAALGGALLFGAPAMAQSQINPQCASMNKIGCTCALETGGEIRGNRWGYHRPVPFDGCMHRAERTR